MLRDNLLQADVTGLLTKIVNFGLKTIGFRVAGITGNDVTG